MAAGPYFPLFGLIRYFAPAAWLALLILCVGASAALQPAQAAAQEVLLFGAKEPAAWAISRRLRSYEIVLPSGKLQSVSGHLWACRAPFHPVPLLIAQFPHVSILRPLWEERMQRWEWKDEYLLGIPAIDLQHKRIFACISRIAQGATDDDRLRAEAEIIKLLGLLQQHFLLEESMMQKFYYPDLEHHIEEHRQFHSDVHHLAQTSLMKKGGVPREALKIAHKWLTEHIMVSDKHYFEFFSNPMQKSRGKKIIAK